MQQYVRIHAAAVGNQKFSFIGKFKEMMK